MVLKKIIITLFKKPSTNPFPFKHIPLNIEKNLRNIKSMVKLPENFRGKIVYNKNKCISCFLCVKFCPSNAMIVKMDKKIKHIAWKCIFCSQCVEVCPVKALSVKHEIFTSSYKKDDMVID